MKFMCVGALIMPRVRMHTEVHVYSGVSVSRSVCRLLNGSKSFYRPSSHVFFLLQFVELQNNASFSSLPSFA